MNKCSHIEQYQGYHGWQYNDWTGEDEYVWIEGEVKSTWIDIDLHRAQCIKCGEISYYSEKARKFYEQGIEDPYIKGLSK